MIRKVGTKYAVFSAVTGRHFGSYATLAEARERLKQVELFKQHELRQHAQPKISPKKSADKIKK